MAAADREEPLALEDLERFAAAPYLAGRGLTGQELRWLGRVLGPGIFDAEHAFTIEQVDDGQVRLVQHEQFRGLLVPFMGRSLDRHTLPAFEQMNQALKRRAEQPQP